MVTLATSSRPTLQLEDQTGMRTAPHRAGVWGQPRHWDRLQEPHPPAQPGVSIALWGAVA